jgi:hypothetical protein
LGGQEDIPGLESDSSSKKTSQVDGTWSLILNIGKIQSKNPSEKADMSKNTDVIAGWFYDFR